MAGGLALFFTNSARSLPAGDKNVVSCWTGLLRPHKTWLSAEGATNCSPAKMANQAHRAVMPATCMVLISKKNTGGHSEDAHLTQNHKSQILQAHIIFKHPLQLQPVTVAICMMGVGLHFGKLASHPLQTYLTSSGEQVPANCRNSTCRQTFRA
eukprot:1162093-Pelagomonas_calceolata.AAC.10